MVGPSVFPEKQVIPKWLVIQYFQKNRLNKNCWIFTGSKVLAQRSRSPRVPRMVGPSVFPDSQALRMVGPSVFPDSQVEKIMFWDPKLTFQDLLQVRNDF